MSKTSPKLKPKVDNTKIEEILNDKELVKELMKRVKNESTEPKKRGRKPLNMSEEEKKELIKERQKQYRTKYKVERELWDSQASEDQKRLIRYLQKHVVPEGILERIIGDIMTRQTA